jgi:Right handed beta helix region
MQLFRNLTFSSLALVVLIALSGQAFAASSNTVGLCAGPGIHYTTIQAAVNAVSPAGTVKVCPGTYPEQVLISGKNLTLIGIGPTASVVVPPATGLVQNGTDFADYPVLGVAAQILVQNANVTISHLTVDGAGNGLEGCGGVNLLGIYYRASSGTITDNAVRNQITETGVGCGYGFGIYVASDSGTAVTISNNSVRNYGKNGIIATGIGTHIPGPNVTVTGNTVVGLGATSLIAGNGIQLSLLAVGKITSNFVSDNVYINPPDCASTNSCWGSSGILLYASPGVTVSSNTVESAQLGIVPFTDPNYGTGDGTIIKSNHIGGTQTFDAIDLCSNNNTVTGNVIYGSSQDAVHVDDACGGSGNNTITGNTINEACAGILGTGTGNTVAPNTYMNVANTTLAGDVCPLPVAPAGVTGMAMAMETSGFAKHLALRPSH